MLWYARMLIRKNIYLLIYISKIPSQILAVLENYVAYLVLVTSWSLSITATQLKENIIECVICFLL